MHNFDASFDRRDTNSVKWTYYPPDVLPLWVADMDFPSPAPVIEALHSFLGQRTFGYEFANAQLRETVSARMDRLYGWQVNPEAVIATPGVIAGFNAAAWAVCRPGAGILTQPPVYPPFFHVADHVGLVNQLAPLQVTAEGRRLHYGIDFDQFAAAFHTNDARTDMFLLCNPHNPTGRAYTRDELQRMASICLDNEVIICSDEIHSELTLGATQHLPIAALSPEVEARTITLIAPSKTFNIPGLFCGFAIIPNAGLRARFTKAAERMAQHVSSPSLVAAQAAFSGVCDGWLDDLRAYLTSNRDFVVAALEKDFPSIRATVPEATYLAWMDCNALGLEPAPYEFFLNKAKVALNKGDDFGPGGEGFVRFNFGSPRQVLAEGLEKMHTALEQR